jgi:hypothetical protein
MGMTQITLRLASSPGTDFPQGDPSRGYVLIAPLTPEGLIDAEVYAAARAACTVRRFEPDQEPVLGRLRRHGSAWYFDYDDDRDSDNEPAFKLGAHPFLVGEYVTIRDETGQDLIYRVGTLEGV